MAKLPNDTGSTAPDDLAFNTFLTALKSQRTYWKGEEELRHNFLNLFQKLVEDLGIKDLRIHMEESIVRGRSDARIGYVVFEFKECGKLDDSRQCSLAIEELVRHLNEYSRKGYDSENLVGVATDAKQIAIVFYDKHEGFFRPVDALERYIELTSAFFEIDNSYALLERVVNGLSRRELSPEKLLEEFGPGTPFAHRFVTSLWTNLAPGLRKRRVAALFETWRRLFSLSAGKIVSPKDLSGTLREYGIPRLEVKTREDVQRFLFVVHTYYSLILKMLTLKIADELRLVGTGSLLGMIQRDPEGGLRVAEETVPKLAINVIQRDVFSWIEDVFDTGLLGVITSLASRIDKYDVHGVRTDVLKRVYQLVIPSKLRKSLGEYYTKDFVADLILDEANYHGAGRILDPACGSGTFLVRAIQRIKRRHSLAPPEVVLNEVFTSVYGFDVNPIAASTARLNYLLSIVDELAATRRGGLDIPVYLCDSVVMPQLKYDVATGAVFQIDTAASTEPFLIPSEIDARRVLTILERDIDKSEDGFLSDVRTQCGEVAVLKYDRTLRVLHKQMRQLDVEDVNHVWCSILRDFFAPLLCGKFDYVVGNPPWVIPERMPKDYSDRVQSLVKKYGYFQSYDPNFRGLSQFFWRSGKGYMACLPFIPLALDIYLKKGGTLAFLMTSSLLRLLNAGGFRKKVLEYRISKIIDLTLYTKIHEGASCWAFIPVVVNEQPSEPSSIDYEFMIPQQGLQT